MKQKLYKWTLKGVGGERTVTAYDEKEARHKAMVERWGYPTGIYGQVYHGIGLDVIKCEEVE